MKKRARAAPQRALSLVFSRRKGGDQGSTLNGPPAGGQGRLRAAAYLRVSKGDQHAENQLVDIQRLVRARGFVLVADYTDKASAWKRRPAFDEMMGAAASGDFQILLVWSLDRLGRSLLGNCTTVVALDGLGVQVVSVREPWLDTRGPVRELLLAVFSWVAQYEREQIAARTLAGLARARARGTRLGRPPRKLTNDELARARALWKAGVPIRLLAQRMRMPRATLHRLVSETGSVSKLEKPRLRRGTRGVSRNRTIGGR